MSAVTAAEFEASYAARSGMTPAAFASYGHAARPCGCGESGCEGWQMVNAANFDADMAAFRRGAGPDPSRGAA